MKIIVKEHQKVEKINQVAFLNKLGTEGVNDIQEAMIELRSPANSEVTIERKGSSNPLIDSGHMLQSTTYQVVKVK